MTHIPDLSSVSYSRTEGPIRAVGWLEFPHDFPHGPVEPAFVERLMALIERPVSGYFYLGMYWCTLCEAAGRVGPDCRTSQRIIFVPSETCVYETPSWIGHYVLGHSYRPPDEFCRAVMSCPAPGSDELRDALFAHLPRLSLMTSLLPAPFFAEWTDGARRTLEPDSQHGSRRWLLDRAARNSRPAPTRDEIIQEHGGLSEVACAWAGCEERALAKLVVCVEHAYPDFKPWRFPSSGSR